jgi:predicted protein tyrosine phosphatase
VTLIVCSLRLVDEMIAARRPSHLITLLSPPEMIDEHRLMGGGRHLRVGVNDIAEPMEGLIVPDEAMVARILDFGSGWTGDAPMLIHCWAGISRSSATAFILACARNPRTSEETIAAHIRTVSPIATPNPRLVELADALLGRGGRMTDAVHAIGRGEAAFENEPFEVPLRFEPDRTSGS